MKISICNSLILVGLILFCIQTSHAQNYDNYVDGYVVTIKGDTLYGKIKLFTELRSCKSVRLVTDKDSSELYFPKQLTSYYRNGELYEVQRTAMNNRVFMKKVVKGKLSVYHYFFRSYYTVNVGGVVAPLMSNPDIIIYVRKEGEGRAIRVQPDGFKKRMSTYLQDFPELAAQIRNKEMKYKDLDRIVQLYNQKFSK